MVRTRKKAPPTSKHTRRLIGVALFLLFLFSLLILQFFRIQIVQHEKWEAKAQAQHMVVVKESFKRGRFFSNCKIKNLHPRTQQPLVIDVPKFHLYIDPKSIPENARDEITHKLATSLKFEKNEILKTREQFEKNSRSRKIKMWVSTDKKEEILSWWQGFSKDKRIARNALYFIKDYQRSYPFGKLLGQVLHTVRELKDEKTGRCIPTGGLEYVFNDYLQGKPGKRLFFRSPRNAMDSGKVVQLPEDGADVYLTINHCLQAIAEEEIEKQVKLSEAKRGWAIMMDPYNGEVLALAQYPFFHPMKYKEYFNDEKKLQETAVKALTDPYEPGSTMKPITMAICLLANEERKKQGKAPLFDPFEKISTKPTFFPGRIKPIRDIRNHKYMNMYMAIQKSSNVYVSQIINRVVNEMGIMWYRGCLQNVFGFGRKLGVGLPGESPGLLPRPGRMHPNGTLEWSLPTPYSLAMGHNILVNSFHMIRAFAIIANGGYDVRPRLVSQVVKTLPTGEKMILQDYSNQTRKQRLLDEKITKNLVRAMKFVTKPGGAARKADIHGYTEAGKTSTSEKIVGGIYSKRDHISTFIGFTPAENPRFVLMVVIDEPAYKYIPGIGNNQYGGNCASPAFKNIGLRSLQYLGIEPDDPFGYPKADPRHDPQRADWSCEVEALEKLYKKWNVYEA